MWKSWKKAPTAIRGVVSKIYVTSFLWCCSETENQCDCLLRFLNYTYLAQAHTLGLLRMIEQLIAEAATQTTNKQHKRQVSILLSASETAIPGRKQLQISKGTARKFVVNTQHSVTLSSVEVHQTLTLTQAENLTLLS